MQDELPTLGHFRCQSCGCIAVGITRASAQQMVDEANRFLLETGDPRLQDMSRFTSCPSCAAPSAAFEMIDGDQAPVAGQLQMVAIAA